MALSLNTTAQEGDDLSQDVTTPSLEDTTPPSRNRLMALVGAASVYFATPTAFAQAPGTTPVEVTATGTPEGPAPAPTAEGTPEATPTEEPTVTVTNSPDGKVTTVNVDTTNCPKCRTWTAADAEKRLKWIERLKDQARAEVMESRASLPTAVAAQKPTNIRVTVTGQGLTAADKKFIAAGLADLVEPIAQRTADVLDIRNRCAFGLGLNLAAGVVLPGSNSSKRNGQIIDYSLDPGLQCRYVGFGPTLGMAHVFNGNDPDYTFGRRQGPNAFFQAGAWVEGDIPLAKKLEWLRLNPGLRIAGLFGGPSNNDEVAQDEGSARGTIVRPYVNLGFKVIDKKDDEGRETFRLDAQVGAYVGGVWTNFVNGDHILGGDPERDNQNEQNFGGVNPGGQAKIKIRF